MKKIAAVAMVTSSIVLTGCQTDQGLYHWGEYESSLYDFYKDPAKQGVFFEQALNAIEQADDRVAPGMYAEYATLLLHQGKTDEAIIYYSKERELWPESKKLMDAMINNLERQHNNDSQKEI